jgi:hypothetical protein
MATDVYQVEPVIRTIGQNYLSDVASASMEKLYRQMLRTAQEQLHGTPMTPLPNNNVVTNPIPVAPVIRPVQSKPAPALHQMKPLSQPTIPSLHRGFGK